MKVVFFGATRMTPDFWHLSLGQPVGNEGHLIPTFRAYKGSPRPLQGLKHGDEIEITFDEGGVVDGIRKISAVAAD